MWQPTAVSLAFISSLVALVQGRQALPACHLGAIIRANPFHFGPMSSFLVAGVTQNHAILVQSVEVPSLSVVPGHWPHPEKRSVTLRLQPCGTSGHLLRSLPTSITKRYTPIPLPSVAELKGHPHGALQGACAQLNSDWRPVSGASEGAAAARRHMPRPPATRSPPPSRSPRYTHR